MIPAEAVDAAMRSMSKTIDALQPSFAEADLRAVIDLRTIATQALEAAAPHMLAEAWDEGVGASLYPDGSTIESVRHRPKNPYRLTK